VTEVTELCCRRIPASCVICHRCTCMACRKVVAPSEEIKTGVVYCVECDPHDLAKLGQLDETQATIDHAYSWLRKHRDTAPDHTVLLVEALLSHICRLRWEARPTPVMDLRRAIEVMESQGLGLTPPHSIQVVETASVEVADRPLTGTCSSCGDDLDALARTGVTGHVCFGPGDSTNHREPS